MPLANADVVLSVDFLLQIISCNCYWKVSASTEKKKTPENNAQNKSNEMENEPREA